MDRYQAEDILEHYGKKGMKWGQRRAAQKAEKRVSSLGSKGKSKTENEFANSKNHLKSAKELNKNDSFKKQLVDGYTAAQTGMTYKSNRDNAKEAAQESIRTAHNAHYQASKHGAKMDKAIAKAKKKGVDTKKLEAQRENFRAYENEVKKRSESQKKKGTEQYKKILLNEHGLN